MEQISQQLREFLDRKVEQYNRPEFIESDPIQIPKMFTQKQDVEIAGFLASTIAWGQRKSIIANAKKMMTLMDMAPYDFVINHTEDDLRAFDGFVHRTFNADDFREFVRCLKKIYQNNGGIEQAIALENKDNDLQKAISGFKKLFFKDSQSQRSFKHISDPEKGSAAKRINMFLRWMVRDDKNGVDFGIWKKIDKSQLSCPLDVHSGNVARYYGLIKRKQNDAKALRELDEKLRELDPKDPAKYDFALFGLGVFEAVK